MASKRMQQGRRKDVLNDLATKITNRYRVTAQEARDIVKAVSNVKEAATMSAKDVKTSTMPYYLKTRAKATAGAAKDVARQTKETARAAATGKKGTTAGKVGQLPDSYQPSGYTKGKKR